MINELFSAIIRDMNQNDAYCQGASQQMANGFYRIFDALEILAGEFDKFGVAEPTIRAIRSDLDQNNAYCQGAPQQAANGSYRVAEILNLIITLLDEDAQYTSATAAILSEMNQNNAYCQGAPQQTANGSYRIVELLDILTALVAPSRSSEVSSCISAMNTTNAYCQGAPQQSANGTDAAFVILQHIVGALDEDKKYVSDLVSLASLKDRNNSYCQGADQQSANNLYRIMETLQVLGYILEDKYQARIEQYWLEHSDERAKLLQEKVTCQQEISAIEREANAINADAEIREIEAEIAALKTKKDRCGAEELAALKSAVEQRKQERAQIGAFKFGLRKEAAAKIEAATAEFAAKQREVDKQKADIQSEIDSLGRRINALRDDVRKKKDKVLEGCEPYQSKISQIDYELTKKR